MDYVKAQQEILAAALADTPRGVLYYHDATEKTTTFCHPSGAYAFVIPDKLVAVNLQRCKQLDRLFITCPAEEEKEITATGMMVIHNKRTLLEFKNRAGVCSYFDKRLLTKYGKGVRLYQEKLLGTATITEAGLTVGYLCPVKYKPENQ